LRSPPFSKPRKTLTASTSQPPSNNVPHNTWPSRPVWQCFREQGSLSVVQCGDQTLSGLACFLFFRFKTPKPAPSSTDVLNMGMALSRASIRSCSSIPRQMATPAWGPAMHPANLDSMEAASFSSTRDTLGSPNERQ